MLPADHPRTYLQIKVFDEDLASLVTLLCNAAYSYVLHERDVVPWHMN